MKHYKIIPVFISDWGCPNQCRFCNQKAINSHEGMVTGTQLIQVLEQYLDVLHNRENFFIELAFFGGSFTGIPVENQIELLEIGKRYCDDKRIDGIRCSTRPDYINAQILERLKYYGVTTIELGVQSFENKVLEASNRGYTERIVFESCRLIQSYHIQLGIQLMIGLPEDTFEFALSSVMKTLEIKPHFLRIYPTLVIKNTQLEKDFIEMRYEPLKLQEAVDWCTVFLGHIKSSNVQLIRMGIQSSEDMTLGNEIVAGPYHPAFKQLVESEWLYRWIVNHAIEGASIELSIGKSIRSTLVGQNKAQIKQLEKRYKTITITEDRNRSNHEICLIVRDSDHAIILEKCILL